MNAAEQQMEEAIWTIDAFLNATTNAGAVISSSLMRRLARCLERTKNARDGCSSQRATSSFVTMCGRYRDSLERLLARLAEMETRLIAERTRLLNEEARLSRTREWHSVLSRTQ